VPGLPDAERLLGEVLAAARDTVARCEHALALVAAHRGVVPSDLAPAAWHADAAACAHAPTTSGACSNGSAPPAIASNGAASAAPSIMTPRETEVVRLIAAGLSNKEIAGELCVSVRTIEHHIANVYRKIGARGKADATAWAVRQHLV
jgi:DNA-binding CsgD family transcriptional regulator